MSKIVIKRDYRVHIVDITELVSFFEHRIEHFVSDYILSHNEINTLFDYCVHKAMNNILNIRLFMNGYSISSSHLDRDIYEDIFAFRVGEFFVNFLYTKLMAFNILVNNQRQVSIGGRLVAFNHTMPIVKLTVVGNALWIFEGSHGD